MNDPLLNNEQALAPTEQNNEDLAMVVAPPREIVALPARIRAVVQNSKARRAILAIATVLVAFKYGRGILEDIAHITHDPDPPARDRIDLVAECVDKLTNTINPSANPVYADALEWFLDGPGKPVTPPTARDCTWATDFAMLFTIVVLRGSLNITTASWYESKPITTTSDICTHKWHRVGCSDNGNIVSLHLSSGDLAGTIPSEIGSLRSLKRIELYMNYDITGTIPTEIGSLSNLEYLYLHRTGISGTLPLTLGKLSKAKEIFLDDTKVVGDMPESICKLRANGLSALHADCGGSDPRVACDKACCKCYDHHRNHTISSSTIAAVDSLVDYQTCYENGASSVQCLSAVISTGEHCVYCTDTRDVPDMYKHTCVTPNFARELQHDVESFRNMRCEGLY